MWQRPAKLFSTLNSFVCASLLTHAPIKSSRSLDRWTNDVLPSWQADEPQHAVIAKLFQLFSQFPHLARKTCWAKLSDIRQFNVLQTAHRSAPSFARSEALLSCSEDFPRFSSSVFSSVSYMYAYICVCVWIWLESVLHSCSTPLPHIHLLIPSTALLLLHIRLWWRLASVSHTHTHSL